MASTGALPAEVQTPHKPHKSTPLGPVWELYTQYDTCFTLNYRGHQSSGLCYINANYESPWSKSRVAYFYNVPFLARIYIMNIFNFPSFSAHRSLFLRYTHRVKYFRWPKSTIFKLIGFFWGVPSPLIQVAWHPDLLCLSRRWDCFLSCGLPNELFNTFFSGYRSENLLHTQFQSILFFPRHWG